MNTKSKLEATSQSLLSAERVKYHQLNESLSKQQYSFSKAKRFKAKTQISDSNIYKQPQTRVISGGVIFKEKRKSFFHVDKTIPGPNKYEYYLDGQFRSKVIKKNYKRIHFALGRSQIKTNNFLYNNEVPSPLDYNPQNYREIKKAVSFTKAKKLAYQKQQFKNVGPGSYRIETSLNEEKQFLSNRLKLPCPKLKNNTQSNNRNREDKSPPLYCPSVTARGEIINLSNKRRGRSIGKDKRHVSYKVLPSPGPGQYSMFSQFIAQPKH